MRCLKLRVISSKRFILLGLIALFSTSVWGEIKPDTLIQSLRKTYIEKAVQEMPDIDPSTFKVTFVNRRVLFSLPEDLERAELNFPSKGTVIGRTVIPLLLYDRYDDVIDRIQLITDIDANRAVYQAKRKLTRKKRIQSNDISKRIVSIQNIPYDAVFSLDEIVGKEVSTTIQKGDIITDHRIKSAPVIHRGDSVGILLDSSTMSLKVQGKSLDEGDVGDTIRVQTQWKAKKIMKGVVLDATTVKVTIH